MVVLVLAALAIGAAIVVVGRERDSDRMRTAAAGFAAAWAKRDTRAMWAQLTPRARATYPLARFAAGYRSAERAATVVAVRVGAVRGPREGRVAVPVALRKRRFGTLRGTIALPVKEDGVAWAPHLRLPGLHAGERVRRSVRSRPRRASVLGADGSRLARDPVGAGIAGTPPSEGERGSGLEQLYDARLAGRSAAELRFGERVIARAPGRPYVGEAFETFVTEQLAFLDRMVGGPTSRARTIVITGAGAGIGLETARRFAAMDWTVCATDINTQALAALEQELGERHMYAEMDVTDTTAITRVFAEFAARHGGAFDVLLNNAGVAFIDNFEAVSLRNHELVVQVNVQGVVNCTHLAFPYLSQGVAPKVINMCSRASDYGVPSEAIYSASKFFVRGFTEAMNIEWERHGIHVLPNFVDTPMMEAAHGAIVDSVGINLTAGDVAQTIVEAAAERTKVHWVVDLPKNKLMRTVLHHSPVAVQRAAVKQFAGF